MSAPYVPPPNPPGPPPPRPTAPSLGVRARVRPRPRFGVALAGAGVVLAIIGVVVWGTDFLAGGLSGGGGGGVEDSRRLLGAGLALVAVLVGYLLVARAIGPLATAGVAASALGVPVCLTFLTVEPSRLSVSGDAVVIVSLLVWLASYLLLPRTRGHVFYLGLATYVLWGYLLDKIEPNALGRAVSGTIVISGSDVAPSSSGGPDWTTIGSASLLIGLLYYLAVFALDRRGFFGAGTGFVVAAFFATVAGIAALASDLGQAGSGVVLLVLGAALAWLAARSERRFTTWVWIAAAVVGIVLLLEKVVGTDHAAAGGIVLIVVGALVVTVAHYLSRATGEPDEVAAPLPR